MEEKTRIEYLFSQYLNNTCSRQEMDELLDFIARAETDEALRRLMNTVWGAARNESLYAKTNWEEIYNSIVGTEKRSLTIAARKTIWRKIAAVAAVFLVSAALFYTYRYFAGQKPDLQYLEAVTGTGEREKIVLPDGSTAWLNANSRLKYPSSFSGKNRDVFLTGQAFFEVRHDKSNPFLVHSRHVSTRVLGTGFEVAAYNDQPSVIVTVLNGRVAVSDSLNSFGIITADRQINYDIATGEAKTLKVNAKALTAWREGDLVFDNITFAEAAGSIEKWYGIDIQFASENLENCRFTASFRLNDDLEQVLAVICGLNQADYVMQDSIVTLKGEGCK